MGWRGRSKSTRFVSDHEESPTKDDGKTYLPGGKIYVTTTKDGKPALGRKKKERLLEDYGFDILGQAFGVRSRIDYEREAEREARRNSIAAQGSAATAPPDPTRHSSKRGGSSATAIKGILKSSSPSAPVCAHCCNGCTCSGGGHDGKASKAKNANFVPPTSPPPVPHHILNGNSTFVIHSRGLPATSTAGPEGFAHQHPNPGNPPPWPPTQSIYVLGPQYVQYPNVLDSQQASMPYSYHEAGPPINLASMPPHPAPPTPRAVITNLSGVEASATPAKSRGPLRFNTNDAEKYEEHYNTAIKGHGQEEDNSDDEREHKKKQAKKNRDVGKRTQQGHFCAGCGRARSNKYHKEHPLKRGQVPEPGYCAKCQHAAAYVESDSTDDTDDTDDTDASEHNYTDHVTDSSDNESCDSSSPMMEGNARPSPSVSSEEDSDFEVSTPSPSPRVKQRRIVRLVLSTKDNLHNMDDDVLRPVTGRIQHIREASSGESQESDSKSDFRTNTFDSATDMKRESKTGTAPAFKPNGPWDNPYVDKVDTSRVPAPEDEIRTSRRAPPGFHYQIRPMGTVHTVSDNSENAPSYQGMRGETHEATNPEQHPVQGQGPSQSGHSALTQYVHDKIDLKARQPGTRHRYMGGRTENGGRNQESASSIERTMVAAGKKFDDRMKKANALGTFPLPTSPMPNFMAHSESSIEEFDSKDGSGNATIPPAPYRPVESSTSSEEMEESKRQARFLEFHNQADKELKTAARNRSRASAVYRSRHVPQESQSKSLQKREEKNSSGYDRKGEPNRPSDEFSLDVHTGHSMNSPQPPSVISSTTTDASGRRRRVRRPSPK
ncbi:hypothetical protein F4804DRAFT_329127 [Jackrogersella minutella]|nr:hypothetical protein F4804DRAFT_329127 [Jackrogersella minutella]